MGRGVSIHRFHFPLFPLDARHSTYFLFYFYCQLDELWFPFNVSDYIPVISGVWCIDVKFANLVVNLPPYPPSNTRDGRTRHSLPKTAAFLLVAPLVTSSRPGGIGIGWSAQSPFCDGRMTEVVDILTAKIVLALQQRLFFYV